jgi:uncharacterized membrane protein (DUF4010 family)
MELIELYQRLGLGLAIGLLIGIERGWQERGAEEGSRTAGIRTFGLIGLLGGLLAILSLPDRFLVLALGFVVFAAALTLFKWREARDKGDYSATTLIAGFLTFTLGAYAALGEMAIAAAAAVAATALLASKALLHGWLRQLEWREIRAALVLLTMTFVLLPILPDRAIDPWETLNPYKIWLMTILIASVSFAGYVAVRAVGERKGVQLAAIAGGLVASTAVTLNFARLAARNPSKATLLSYGAVLAGAVMMVRVLVIVIIIAPIIFLELAIPLLAAAAASALLAYICIHDKDNPDATDNSLQFDNPFDLDVVLKFGALLAAMLVISRFVQSSFGDPGLFGLAAIAGSVDVDAITLSIVQMKDFGLTTGTMAHAILIAVLSNTLSKVCLGWLVGGRRVGIPMTTAAVAAISAAVATLVLYENIGTYG